MQTTPNIHARLRELQLRALERLAELMESEDPREARLAATAILKARLPESDEAAPAAEAPEPETRPAPPVAPLSERCSPTTHSSAISTLLSAAGGTSGRGPSGSAPAASRTFQSVGVSAPLRNSA